MIQKLTRTFKIVVTTVAIIAAVLLITYFILDRLIHTHFSDMRLRKAVIEIIQDNFNKAAKLDSVVIRPNGKIVIKNLKISAYDDFNDNRLLVDSPLTNINLDFKSMLSGQIKLKNIVLKKAHINIHKAYDEEYSKNVDIISGLHRRYRNAAELSSKKLKISIKDSELVYSETFRYDTVEMRVHECLLDFIVTKEYVQFNSTGKVERFKTPLAENGGYHLSGRIIYRNDGFYGAVVNYDYDNLDLSFVNPYIQKKKSEYEFSGSTSGRLQLNVLYDNLSFSFFGRQNGFTVKHIPKIGSQRNIINNLDYDLIIEGDSFGGFQNIMLHSLQFNSENLSIDADCEYTNTSEDRSLKTNFKTNRIDLDNLSQQISLTKGGDYCGQLQIDGAFNYDFISHQNFLTNVRLIGKGLGVNVLEDGHHKILFQDSDIELQFTEDSLNLGLSGNNGRSELKAEIIGDIEKWSPLSSRLAINISSEKMNAADFANSLRQLNCYVREKAAEDNRLGYDGVMFPDLPYGEFLTNNDIQLDLKFDKMYVSGDAFFSDFHLQQVVEKRMLYTKIFQLNGFDGVYNFSLSGNMKNDFVHFKSKADVSGLDLGKLYTATGHEGQMSGTFDSSFSWSVSGYRLRDLLRETNKVDFSSRVSNGFVEGTPLLKRYSTFVDESGAGFTADAVNFNSAVFRFAQSGWIYSVREFSLNSDVYNFNTRGDYILGQGYNLYLTLRAKNIGEKKSPIQSVNYKLVGIFDQPTLITRKEPAFELKLLQ